MYEDEAVFILTQKTNTNPEVTFDIPEKYFFSIFFTGVRGTTVAVARLGRENEVLFKPNVSIDRINSMNNFKFSEDGTITVHRQYEIGPGKVKRKKYKQ